MFAMKTAPQKRLVQKKKNLNLCEYVMEKFSISAKHE